MITIDQKTLNHLQRLWRDRAKTLTQAAMLLPDGPNTDKIRQVADAYGQCSEELEEPPMKLFCALGYDSENDEMRDGERKTTANTTDQL